MIFRNNSFGSWLFLRKILLAIVMVGCCISKSRAGESGDLQSVTTRSYEGCPTPLNKLNYAIRSDVKFHANTEIYEYHYEVQLRPTSQHGLADFWFQADGVKTPVVSPRGWSCSDLSSASWKYIRLSCGNVVAAPLRKGEKDDGQIPPPLYPVSPGKSATFIVQSKYAPGPVMVYLSGEGKLPEFKKGNAGSCPADSIGGFDQVAVLDSMPGPLNAQNLKLEFLSHAESNVIYMNEPTIKVGIVQTSALDLSAIEPASIRLGAKQAAPLPGTIQQIKRDGAKLLSIDFALQKTGIHCQDKAVFLMAKTKSRQSLQGSMPINIQNCKMEFLPFGEED